MSESPITEHSESTPAKRKRTASKENQPPAGRVNAQKLQNGRNRQAKESLSKPIQSVLAPSIPPPPKSHLLGTNELLLQPALKTTVENTLPIQQVIKTPVYQNLNASSHTFRTHQPHTHTINLSMNSGFATFIFPFPLAEQIASDVIKSIIQNFHCKTSLETFIRKINLLKFRPHIIKQIQLMLANTPSRIYRTLDEIVIACLQEFGI